MFDKMRYGHIPIPLPSQRNSPRAKESASETGGTGVEKRRIGETENVSLSGSACVHAPSPCLENENPTGSANETQPT